MKRLNYILLAVLSFGIFLGFSVNDNPTNGARQFSNESSVSQEPAVTDNNNPSVISGFPYYTDDFDGANDTTSLIGRGYEIYRRGGPPGVAAIWFQGNPTVFVAFNGPDSGYVASNYQSTTGANPIDNWLVLPPLNVVSGDSIFFRERSVQGNPFPDSMRVMYNPTGSSLPEDANWVELGRFLNTIDGSWGLRGFAAPSSGVTARFAIRYAMVNAGPFGDNSNYAGIDALVVSRDEPLPVELASFTSVITNSNVVLNWSTSSETNNSRFEVERSSNGVWSKVGSVNGNGTTTEMKSYSFTDRNLATGNYNYRLKQIDFNGNFEYYDLSNEVIIGVPSAFDLAQNYPNPFNPSTTINYQIVAPGKVTLALYDLNGREVKSLVNELKEAGYYTVSLNASDLSSGIYFYSLTSGNSVMTKKLTLVK